MNGLRVVLLFEFVDRMKSYDMSFQMRAILSRKHFRNISMYEVLFICKCPVFRRSTSVKCTVVLLVLLNISGQF